MKNFLKAIGYAGAGLLFVVSATWVSSVVVKTEDYQNPVCYEEQNYANSWSPISGDVHWIKKIQVRCPKELEIYNSGYKDNWERSK